MSILESKNVSTPLGPEERGQVLKAKREALRLTKTALASKVKEKLDLDKFDYKRIADWETGRIHKIPEDIKSVLYEILRIDEKRDLYRELTVNIHSAPMQMTLIRELVSFADIYVFEHSSEMSKDEVYSRAVKNDVRDILEEFFRVKDGLK